MTDFPNLPPDVEALFDALDPPEAEGLREVWALTAPTANPLGRDLALARLQAAMQDAPPHLNGTPSPRPARRRWGRRPLAASRPAEPDLLNHLAPDTKGVVPILVLALALVGVAVWGGVWLSSPIAITASSGAQPEIVLADGSTVVLNSGSTLRYPRRFGETRAVELTGEAFFDIVPGAAPFTVTTHDAVITVLGTRFGVRAWPLAPEAATVVALQEGRVRLAPRQRPGAVVLAPGEVRRVGEGPLAATVPDALAWRGGEFVFKDRPLGDVLGDVERRFGVDVEVEPVGLSRRRVSVALRDPASAEAVVRDLSLAFGLTYRARSGGFVLTGTASGDAPPRQRPAQAVP